MRNFTLRIIIFSFHFVFSCLSCMSCYLLLYKSLNFLLIKFYSLSFLFNFPFFIDNPSKVVFVIKTNLHVLKTCRLHVFKWNHKMKIPTTRMKIANFWIMNMIQNMAKVFGKFLNVYRPQFYVSNHF